MKNTTLLLLLFVGWVTPKAQTISWENGYWFENAQFRQKTVYTVNGKIIDASPTKIDRTVDLGGQYVIPPLGDAHHHGIDSENGLQEKLNSFLRDGIFYVKNPNVIPEMLTPQVRASINKPTSIDVQFSNGGLTSTNGHPVRLHNMLASRGVFGALKPEDMENNAYYIIDSENDLEKKWSLITSKHPDFIKTFMLFTDESGKKKREGLTPEVLKAVVAKAHKEKLRVSTHIETARDFKYAVDAGVDEINHIPIPRNDFDPSLESFRIDASTAQRAAEMKVYVVATVRDGIRRDTTGIKAAIEMEKYNSRLLFNSGVPLTVGSDGISGEKPMVTALNSILYMAKHNFFDNATLLKIATQTTPATIFPDRKVGLLKEGYEASFLVLSGNPINDINSLKNIVMRIKEGVILPEMSETKATTKRNVTFTLKGYEGAKEVTIAGTFNGWSPNENTMKKGKEGWTVTLDLDPGKVLYKFVIDGQWILDPANTREEEDGPYTNSVLIVK